jgi:DNA-binding response OmpR family regulator
MKILLIEDDNDLRECIKDQFERQGATVYEAEDGKKGLGILEHSEVDLVLSDVQMPKLDGMGLLKQALSQFVDCPPIYIMSGHSNFHKDDFLTAGASGYFEKPLSLCDLKGIVQKFK